MGKYIATFTFPFLMVVGIMWFIAFAGGVKFGTGMFGFLMFIGCFLGLMAGGGLTAAMMDYDASNRKTVHGDNDGR